MNKQDKYVQFILDELNNKNIIYTDVLKIFLSRFKVSEPTFVTYWKIANQHYSEGRISLQNKFAALDEANEIEKLKSLFITRNQLIEMQGNAVKLSYDLMNEFPTASNIDAFNKTSTAFAKLEGFNKPDKVAETDSEGKDKDVTITIVKTYEK